MICPIDPHGHDCEALDLFYRYPNDYPECPCGNCNQQRINELEEKLKKQKLKKEERVVQAMATESQKQDRVNHPSHYTFGEIEVIDYIRDKLTPEQFQGYCEGNVLKYVSRWEHKGGLEDLQKARVYLDWMIESVEKASGIYSKVPQELLIPKDIEKGDMQHACCVSCKAEDSQNIQCLS